MKRFTLPLLLLVLFAGAVASHARADKPKRFSYSAELNKKGVVCSFEFTLPDERVLEFELDVFGPSGPVYFGDFGISRNNEVFDTTYDGGMLYARYYLEKDGTAVFTLDFIKRFDATGIAPPEVIFRVESVHRIEAQVVHQFHW